MYVWSHLWHYCLCINATPKVILSYFRLPYICQLANVPAQCTPCEYVNMGVHCADASIANPADPTDLLTPLFLHLIYELKRNYPFVYLCFTCCFFISLRNLFKLNLIQIFKSISLLQLLTLLTCWLGCVMAS